MHHFELTTTAAARRSSSLQKMHLEHVLSPCQNEHTILQDANSLLLTIPFLEFQGDISLSTQSSKYRETHYINCASQVFLCLLPDKTKELGTRFCTSSSHKSSSSSSFLSFFLWARLVSVMQCSSGHQTYLVFKSQGKSALLPTTAQLFPLQQQLSLLLKTKQKIAI